MSVPFSPNTVQSLAERIDAQVASLGATRGESVQRSLEPSSNSALAEQAAEIERITQEKPVRFLKKFRKAAKQDICEEGGVLNAQWQRWQDLASRGCGEKLWAVSGGDGVFGRVAREPGGGGRRDGDSYWAEGVLSRV